ncbi:hypothetical protein AMQ83_13250 [Paenibacillus riograndensis]|nr:hypothetical protein AMQ83_13250 [Paenibacillus riograndensis]
MELRFMKLQGNVNIDSDVVFPTDFKGTNYYKPYVGLAVQQGLLDKAAEMAPDNLKTSWGERKASREWVAELLIRALGKTTEAAAVSGKPTGFADDAKVAANKRGYVNSSVGLGLTNVLDGNRMIRNVRYPRPQWPPSSAGTKHIISWLLPPAARGPLHTGRTRIRRY